MQAVVAMTEDKSFHLQTPQASRALKIGRLISENIPSDDNAALEGLSKYCLWDQSFVWKSPAFVDLGELLVLNDAFYKLGIF